MNKNLKFLKNKKTIKDYKIWELLGQGSYAKVYKATNINKKWVAIKIYDKLKISTESRIKNLNNEINVFEYLKYNYNSYFSKYYVNYYNNFEDDKNYYLVLEYIDGITLKEYINKNYKNGILKANVNIIIKRVLKALNFLHINYIYHRDLKCSNIMIVKANKLKIIDFGFSIKNNSYEKLEKFLGTFNYLSPEILLKQKYNGDKNDIWAFGVIMYQLISGSHPFKGKDRKELKANIIKLSFHKKYKFDTMYQALFDNIFILDPEVRKSSLELIHIINKYK